MYVYMYIRTLCIYVCMYVCMYLCMCTFFSHLSPFYSFVHYFHILHWSEGDPAEPVQTNLQLQADCNNDDSEAQSNLRWNPASLSKQISISGSVPCNFNFEYTCYNLSSSGDQVDTIIGLFS